ncbi:carbohydrate ABC transporter permease [Nonomuraea sediminis]|uniref:carbohydrate ABC transporter permease n=1 Tax=Nonomuraea sediminis TaxID=2835864 RepID=UPI0027DF98F6|nr:sugar ABC transporter permease [Nonomuraea sediminis]
MAVSTLAAPSRARIARGGPLERQANRLFWPFVGPALAFYGLLFLAPIVFAAWTSLYKWDGMGVMRWRGLDNYRTLLDDQSFHYAVVNTIKILVVGGVATFAVSFALTLALREMAGKMFARSVLFFPCLVNALVFGIAAGFLFGPNGPVNALLRLVGIDAVPKWLSVDNLPAMIIAAIVWTATGYYTTIIMAAVDQIPTYLYEAAELEGANAWQRFRHITLPMSWEVVSVCAVLWTVSSVKVFEIVLLFGGGSTVSNAPIQTWTTAMYVYFSAFPGSSVPKLGLASAAAVVSLVMVGVFVVILRRLMRRERVRL